VKRPDPIPIVFDKFLFEWYIIVKFYLWRKMK
jgi:hypothetical protein